MPKKVDRNQPEIVKKLRAIGATVQHTHEIGKGYVDIVVGWKGVNYMFEIKNPSLPPSQRKLTPDEIEFHNSWRGQVAIIETFDDAMKIINKAV